MATMSNTFGPGGQELTARASAPAAGPKPLGGLDPGLLSKLVALKLAGQEQPAQRAPGQAMQQPAYVPQMASQPAPRSKEEVITRVVKDPFASPYQKMATGFDIGSKTERGFKRSDGSIQWEFDDIRPHGSSGGIQGGGAASTLHPTANLAAKMPAHSTGSPEQGEEQVGVNRAQAGGTAANIAMQAATNPYNRNNDARGEGYGIDYGRKRPAASQNNDARSALVSAIRAGRAF